MQKLPSNVFHYSQLHIFDLSHCLQELLTSIGQLNALQEFNLSYSYRLQELSTSFGQLMHFKNLICQTVLNCKTYLHLLVN